MSNVTSPRYRIVFKDMLSDNDSYDIRPFNTAKEALRFVLKLPWHVRWGWEYFPNERKLIEKTEEKRKMKKRR